MAVWAERVEAHYIQILLFCTYSESESKMAVSQLKSRHVFGGRDNVTVMVTLFNVRDVENWVMLVMPLR